MVRCFERVIDVSDFDNSDGSVSYRFAIIGGGLTGTSLLCQLVDELARMGEAGHLFGSRLGIDVFEKGAEVGPGLPHSSAYVLPFHITNMCARDMTVRISRSDDFQRWVERNTALLCQHFDHEGLDFSASEGPDEHCAHYPREVMGEYLKNQLDDAAQRAEEIGIEVKIWSRCEVVDLWEEKTNIYLTVAEDQRGRKRVRLFQGALLATGHWFESSRIDNYFTSPWPASKLLAAIPPGTEVGVIGSSLSAIETALTLSAEGRFHRLPAGRLRYEKPDKPRRLILFSRQGLVPRVRGRIGSRRNRYFTCDRMRKLIADHPHRICLSELFLLLDQELSEAYGTPIDWQEILDPSESPVHILRQDIDRAVKGDGSEGELVWQTVLVQIFPIVRALYLHLGWADKKRFDREFNTLFFIHAATQPAINAEKLLALMEAGIVEVKKLGRDYRFACNESTGKFEFHYTGPDGHELCDIFPYCVDARGQPRSIETDSSELTRNLLKSGVVQIKRSQPGGGERSKTQLGGSILIDPETHLVMQSASNNPLNQHLQLFAVGAMTRGQIIDSSMALGLAHSTAKVVEYLITRLS